MEVERQYVALCGHLVFRRRDASVPAIELVAQTGASALGKPFAAAVLRRIVEQILSFASRRPGPDRASSSLTSNPPLRLQVLSGVAGWWMPLGPEDLSTDPCPRIRPDTDPPEVGKRLA